MRLERGLLIGVEGGLELSADVYLPEGPGPFPALVSPTPYRKDDYIGAAWERPTAYFAERGYATVLVDFHGHGGSNGVAGAAMNPEEADDAVAAVEWAARQSWCNGRIGMWGVSYGGITAFRTAAARPPSLRTIVAIYASSDIYADFVYPGGCFNCLGVGAWTSLMLAMQLAPPMYRDAKGRWRRIWLERLEHAVQPYMVDWFEHRRRDEFWSEKAITLESIEVPTFLIGGWRDLYPEAMTRAYERISAPRKLWMGPWAHVAPEAASVAAVDYLSEMCRWFDRFLRDEQNGVENEPPVTLYVQGDAAGWTREHEWPIARAVEQVRYLARGDALVDDFGELDTDAVEYTADPAVGTCAGLWDARGTGLGLPLDQAEDDRRSLAFTSAELTEPLEITGSPEAILVVAADSGFDVDLVVKLCDVAPDAGSELITTGWLKLAHPVGDFVEARVALWATAYRVAAGHRLRVSVACADFPRIWPMRSNPRIRIGVGPGRTSLIRLASVRPRSALGWEAPPPSNPAIIRAPRVLESTPSWRRERDVDGRTESVVFRDRRVMDLREGDGRFSVDTVVTATVPLDAPDGAVLDATTVFRLDTSTGERAVAVADTRVTQDGFDINGRVELDGEPLLDRRWMR